VAATDPTKEVSMPDPAAPPRIIAVDTITKLDPSHRGQVVIAASHGGEYAGYCAARGGVRAVIFNDAGIGKDRAGIGSLPYLDGLGIVAATVRHLSCRIGDGADMREHGIVSHVNEGASRLGCAPGQSVAECATNMLAAPLSDIPVPARAESRFVIRDTPGQPRVVAMDSASLVEDGDVGSIVIAASHGALIGGQADKAIGRDVLAAVFSDAGVGKDRVGISRLPALDRRAIAAATVSAESARIGDGRSVYEEGVLSHVNETARAMGIAPGMSVRDFVDRVTERATRA
jgi:hypothetical protein